MLKVKADEFYHADQVFQGVYKVQDTDLRMSWILILKMVTRLLLFYWGLFLDSLFLTLVQAVNFHLSSCQQDKKDDPLCAQTLCPWVWENNCVGI